MQRRLILVFFLLSALGSWLPVWWLFSSGHDWSTVEGRGVAVWYAFPPLLAALFISGARLHQPILTVFGISLRINRWWLFAWLAPLVALALAFVLLWFFDAPLTLSSADLIAQKRALIPASELSVFDQYVREHGPPQPWLLLLWALPAGITFNVLPAFAEEVGFRSFLFREVPGNFWQRSLRIAGLWALWLTPAAATGMFGDVDPARALLTLCAWCVVLSPILVYIRARSESVIPVAIFRGTLAALTMPAVDIAYRVPTWLRPTHGVSMTLAFALMLLGLAIWDRHHYSTRLL